MSEHGGTVELTVADDAFSAGQRALEQQCWEEAINYFSEAISLCGPHRLVEAYNNRGKTNSLGVYFALVSKRRYDQDTVTTVWWTLKTR